MDSYGRSRSESRLYKIYLSCDNNCIVFIDSCNEDCDLKHHYGIHSNDLCKI